MNQTKTLKGSAWKMKENKAFNGDEEIRWSWNTLKTMWWLGKVWERQLRGRAQKFTWTKWRKAMNCLTTSSLSFA